MPPEEGRDATLNATLVRIPRHGSFALPAASITFIMQQLMSSAFIGMSFSNKKNVKVVLAEIGNAPFVPQRDIGEHYFQYSRRLPPRLVTPATRPADTNRRLFGLPGLPWPPRQV
jgi:hypothetical protein